MTTDEASPRGERPVGLPEVRQAPCYISDLAVDVLRELGVKYIPLNPGSSFRGFHDSIVNHGQNELPQLILCVHEEIAVAMAHSYAKATGDVAVAAVHDLVGLMHATMAIYDAWCDGAPVMVLGGGGPVDGASRRGIDWIHSASTQATLVRDYVKWDDEPMSASTLADSMLRGHALANSAPPGPVYVTLDMDLQERKLAERHQLPDPARRAGVPVVSAAKHSVERAAELLLSAKNPVIVAGSMSFDHTATHDLVALAESLGAACRDDHNAVAFPTTHPLNLSGDVNLLSADSADVVLAVDVTDPGTLLLDCSPTTQVIDVSLRHLRQRGWSNAEGPPADVDLHLAAEPREGVRQLVAAVRDLLRHETSDVADRRKDARQTIALRHTELRATQEQMLKDRWDETPISPPRMVAEVWDAVRSRDWLLTLRNTRTWPEGVWEFSDAGQWLGSSGGGGIGYGPGAILGGAIAARDRGQTAVAIIGDGDLHMGIGALWTAVHYQLPVLVVVNNNRSFYNDEMHQRRVAESRGRPTANSWIGMRLESPEVDFAGVARSYGAWAEGPIEDPADLAAALQRALHQVDLGHVALLDVRTSPE